MADCCSENMSVVLAPGSVGSKPGGLVHPLPGSKASLQVQSKIREARRADTQDLLRHSWSFTSVLCQPSGLCA